MSRKISSFLCSHAVFPLLHIQQHCQFSSPPSLARAFPANPCGCHSFSTTSKRRSGPLWHKNSICTHYHQPQGNKLVPSSLPSMRFQLALSSAIFASTVSAWKSNPKDNDSLLRDETRTLLQGTKTTPFSKGRGRRFRRFYDNDLRKTDVLQNLKEGLDDHQHPLQATCNFKAQSDVGILQCGEGYDCVPIQGRPNDGSGICLPHASTENWEAIHQGGRWMTDEDDFCQTTVRLAENGDLDYENCDYTHFNFEDGSGHFTCQGTHCGDNDEGGTTNEEYCNEWAVYYDCNRNPPYAFVCYRIRCTTSEQVCSQQLLYGMQEQTQTYDWTATAVEVDGKQCTIHECQRESCSTETGFTDQCIERDYQWPDCPGFTIPFCDDSFSDVLDLFVEERCVNPFSIPGVTGSSTCNSDSTTPSETKWEGVCGTLNFGSQNGSNNSNSNSNQAGDTQNGSNNSNSNSNQAGDTQGETGGNSPKQTGPVIEGQSSGSRTVIGRTLMSIALVGILTDFLLLQ